MISFSVNDMTKEAAFKASGFSELRDIFSESRTLRMSSGDIRAALIKDYGFTEGKAAGAVRRAAQKGLLHCVGNAEYVYNIDFPNSTATYISEPDKTVSVPEGDLFGSESKYRMRITASLSDMFMAMGQDIDIVTLQNEAPNDFVQLRDGLSALMNADILSDEDFKSVFNTFESEHMIPVLLRYVYMTWDLLAFVSHTLSITDMSDDDLLFVSTHIQFVRSLSAHIQFVYHALNSKFHPDFYGDGCVDNMPVKYTCKSLVPDMLGVGDDMYARLEFVPSHIFDKMGTGEICFGKMRI